MADNDLNDLYEETSSGENEELTIIGLDDDSDEIQNSENIIPQQDNNENSTEDINEERDDELSTLRNIDDFSEQTEQRELQKPKNNNYQISQNKKLKILVGNGRPGLGKSTVAMQLIAPYLFSRNSGNKVPLYIFESLSDNNLFSTQILDAISVEVKENSFDNSVINILTKDEAAVYDIGGGKTTQIVMEALINTGLIYGIDLFVIPLTDGKHEAKKAKDFYDLVKEHNPEANIVFVLNKVAHNTCYDDVCMQYIDFLGDRGLIMDATRGIIEDVSPEDRNLVHLHNDDIIKYSVRHEKTVFELAFTKTEDCDDLLKKAFAENDTAKQKYLSARKNNVAKAKKYFEGSIQPSIGTFNRILGQV